LENAKSKRKKIKMEEKELQESIKLKKEKINAIPKEKISNTKPIS
jgi:hypothetical protein